MKSKRLEDAQLGTVLVSTLHDPLGQIAPFLKRSVPFLNQLYQQLMVIATPETASETVHELHTGGIRVDTDGNEHIGDNRRRVLGRGLADGNGASVHYCDFDRLVYWALNYPDELVHVVETIIPEADYTAIGRTPVAFASHPPVQQELESMTNEVFSAFFGREMDVTAGSCGISQRAGRYLLRHSREMSNATDTEWPSLIGCAGDMEVKYVAVDGLAFETVFFDSTAHERAHTAGNWAKRARLAHDSIRATIRIQAGIGASPLNPPA